MILVCWWLSLSWGIWTRPRLHQADRYCENRSHIHLAWLVWSIQATRSDFIQKKRKRWWSPNYKKYWARSWIHIVLTSEYHLHSLQTHYTSWKPSTATANLSLWRKWRKLQARSPSSQVRPLGSSSCCPNYTSPLQQGSVTVQPTSLGQINSSTSFSRTPKQSQATLQPAPLPS